MSVALGLRFLVLFAVASILGAEFGADDRTVPVLNAEDEDVYSVDLLQNRLSVVRAEASGNKTSGGAHMEEHAIEAISIAPPALLSDLPLPTDTETETYDPPLGSGRVTQEVDPLEGALDAGKMLNTGTLRAEANKALDDYKHGITDRTEIVDVLNSNSLSMTPTEALHNHALVTGDTIEGLVGPVEDSGCYNHTLCFQGDMMASSQEQLKLFQKLEASKQGLGGRAALVGGGTPWTDGTLDYCFASDITTETQYWFQAAVDQYKAAVPCLSFRNVGNSAGASSTSAEAAQVCDDSANAIFVKSVPGDGCWAYVGMLDARVQKNFMNLETPKCNVLGSIIHELGHALGMYHEMSRFDRDNYVTIHWENIKDGKEDNFESEEVSYTSGAYDYLSIMHYTAFGMSKNGEKTITTPDGVYDSELGQRVGLSQYDADQVAAMYIVENDQCTASLLDDRVGCKDKDPAFCATLTDCFTEMEMETCCACGGGETHRCWSGSTDACNYDGPTLPIVDHSECVPDTTHQYVGYDCVVAQICTYTVIIKCPEAPGTRWQQEGPATGKLPPLTDPPGHRWSGPCTGGCTYAAESRPSGERFITTTTTTTTTFDETEFANCIVDRTASFSGYACVTQNRCDFTVELRCPEAPGYKWPYAPAGCCQLPPSGFNGACTGGCSFSPPS